MIRRIAQTHTVKFANALPEGQVLAVLSTNDVDRVGDIIVQSGIDFRAFMAAGGPVLWQHDANYPVARTLRMDIANGRLEALAQFPPPGTSSQSDECYRLIKAGVVTGTSIGFIPRQWEWIDPRRAQTGIRFTEVELVEYSFVSIPANRDALIIGKSYPAAPRSGTARAAPRSTWHLHYAGTLAQRLAQLHWDYPEIEQEEAATERDAAILHANAELTGRERRYAIAAAWGRYLDRRH